MYTFAIMEDGKKTWLNFKNVPHREGF